MSGRPKYKLKTTKVEKSVVEAYQKLERSVVKSYFAVENVFVGTYQKIEDKFVDTFLEEVKDDNDNEERLRINDERETIADDKNKNL